VDSGQKFWKNKLFIPLKLNELIFLVNFQRQIGKILGVFLT